jgi:hypothetical protein
MHAKNRPALLEAIGKWQDMVEHAGMQAAGRGGAGVGALAPGRAEYDGHNDKDSEIGDAGGVLRAPPARMLMA